MQRKRRIEMLSKGQRSKESLKVVGVFLTSAGVAEGNKISLSSVDKATLDRNGSLLMTAIDQNQMVVVFEENQKVDTLGVYIPTIIGKDRLISAEQWQTYSSVREQKPLLTLLKLMSTIAVSPITEHALAA